MRRKTTARQEQVAAFILGLVVDGPRRSTEIHDLAEKYFGVKALLPAREILAGRIKTGVSGGPGAGRAKYWKLVRRSPL
jgi:hypothetical protein